MTDDKLAPRAGFALRAVAEKAAREEADALVRLQSALGDDDPKRLTSAIRRAARLTLNFHPDRVDASGRTVAEGLRQDGVYRSQFETGISNGGRSAVAGGDRARWENELFGGAYDDERCGRPSYGALDLTNDPHGGSPRFGSSFIILEEVCFDRATFCVGDSHTGPDDIGTIERFASVLAGIFEQGASGDGLGRGLSVAELLALVQGDMPSRTAARCLDGYAEAQVHGGMRLERDVSSIVLDPSYRDTNVEEHMSAAAHEFRFSIGWHRGSELLASEVPADFRGPTMPGLGQRTAQPGAILDAARIGRALRSINYTPPIPAGDAADSALQQYKYLWHCLLRFGHDAEMR